MTWSVAVLFYNCIRLSKWAMNKGFSKIHDYLYSIDTYPYGNNRDEILFITFWIWSFSTSFFLNTNYDYCIKSALIQICLVPNQDK